MLKWAERNHAENQQNREIEEWIRAKRRRFFLPGVYITEDITTWMWGESGEVQGQPARRLRSPLDLSVDICRFVFSLAADRATGTGLSLETDLIAVISVWLLLKVFWVATSIAPSVLTSPHLAALWQVLTSEVLALLCLTKTDPSGGGKE